jgi:hypothetical protein
MHLYCDVVVSWALPYPDRCNLNVRAAYLWFWNNGIMC